MTKRTIVTAAASIILVLGAAVGTALFSGVFTSSAVQTPKISLDMNGNSNTYVPSVDNDFDGLPDPGSNVMSVGTIENCFNDPSTTNTAHLIGFGGTNTTDPRFQVVVKTVEDMIGYQARINFDGTKLAITSPGQVNDTPFTDGTKAINFLNLPVDEASQAHKSLFAAPPDIAANSALIGSAALGVDTVGSAPDVPSKSPHDQTTRTYQANGGGVLAQLQFVVRAGQVGQTSLRLDLDDASPNSPGSKVDIFTPTGTQ